MVDVNEADDEKRFNNTFIRLEQLIEDPNTPEELKDTASCLRFLKDLKYIGSPEETVEINDVEYRLRPRDTDILYARPKIFITTLLDRSISILNLLNTIRTRLIKNDRLNESHSIHNLIQNKAIIDLFLAFSVIRKPKSYGFETTRNYISMEEGNFFIDDIADIYDIYLDNSDDLLKLEESNSREYNDYAKCNYVMPVPVHLFFECLANLDVMRKTGRSKVLNRNPFTDKSVWDVVAIFINNIIIGSGYIEWPKE